MLIYLFVIIKKKKKKIKDKDKKQRQKHIHKIILTVYSKEEIQKKNIYEKGPF